MASLGEFLSGAASVIAPFNPAVGAAVGAVGGLISGSTPSVGAIGITQAQQAALSGGFGGPTTSSGTAVGPPIGVPTFGVPSQANLGGIVPPLVRGVVRQLPAIVGGAAGGAIAQRGSSMALGPAPAPRTMTQKQFILATARAFHPGATSKKIIRSARQCGIELAAATFGLDVLQVCFLISSPPTRRSRGISAADIRRTRSTMRKINSLKNICPPARRRK